MIEGTIAAPESPAPPRASRVWRMVLIVVSVQLVLIAIVMVLFTAMGLANEGPTGSCGGA